EVIRWAVTVFLLLFELSIVLFKWAGSLHDKAVRQRLRDALLWTDARGRARREKIDEYARRDVDGDLALELECATARRDALRDSELGRLRRRASFRPAGAPATTGTASTGEPAATADGDFMGGPSADPSPTPVPGDDDREPQRGEVVVGRYRLIDQIGS